MTVFKISISGADCKSVVFLSHDEEAGECLYCVCSCAHVSVCVCVCTCTHVHARSKLHIHFILVLDLFPSLCLCSNAAYNISVHPLVCKWRHFTKQERPTLYKGADSDCFRVCHPRRLCLTYSAVILWAKRSLGQHEMRGMAVWKNTLS